MKTKKIKDSCPSCGVKWIKHKGIEYTCRRLKFVLAALSQIARTPHNKGARRNAIEALEFLGLFK